MRKLLTTMLCLSLIFANAANAAMLCCEHTPEADAPTELANPDQGIMVHAMPCHGEETDTDNSYETGYLDTSSDSCQCLDCYQSLHTFSPTIEITVITALHPVLLSEFPLPAFPSEIEDPPRLSA